MVDNQGILVYYMYSNREKRITMKRNYRKAYVELKKMGCPVLEGGYYNTDTFRISAEDNVTDTWADYYAHNYGEFGVKQEVCDVLRKHGLYAEWINPGVLAVHNIYC